MILIGQYDSPFVRRVGIALEVYGLGFEHRPWSTFGDGDQIAPYNPLRRVPTLVLDDGEVLIESAYILDALDQMAGPDRALLPADGPGRRSALKICALASGLADKAVSLIYEAALHEAVSTAWIERCQTQIGAVLDALERDRGQDTWWAGGRISHADIMVGCALRFLQEAHPGLFNPGLWPRLTAHGAACEALPAFVSIKQSFTPPRHG